MSQNIRFNNKSGVSFTLELKKSVAQYFTDNNISRNANTKMVVKTIVLLSLYLGAYGLIISGLLGYGAMLAAAVLMGLGKAGIGFSVSHDALHGSYSKNKTVNRILGASMDLIGGNAYMWRATHNRMHHTFTNIYHADEDIDVTDAVRLSPDVPYKNIYRFQHLYWPVTYCMTTLYWVFAKDYKKLLEKQDSPYHVPHTRKDVINMIIPKLLYYAYTIAIPLLVMHITWWQFLIGFLVMHATAGFILGIVFQLAHVVEKTIFPTVQENGNVEDAWTVHQFKTTANFARKNALVTWYVGGLNFQIEHHLFPDVCSIHYPAISNIVKSVAEKHGVPYNDYPTFMSAVNSHVRLLKAFGRPESASEIVICPLTGQERIIPVMQPVYRGRA